MLSTQKSLGFNAQPVFHANRPMSTTAESAAAETPQLIKIHACEDTVISCTLTLSPNTDAAAVFLAAQCEPFGWKVHQFHEIEGTETAWVVIEGTTDKAFRAALEGRAGFEFEDVAD